MVRGCQNGKKVGHMSFPSSNTPSSGNPLSRTSPATPAARSPGLKQPLPRPCHRSAGNPDPSQFPWEREHQLEKLQFALAIAISRGRQERIQVLRSQIAALGGDGEEPGT